MAGLWEFPGGKVAPGETPEAALVRELHEELGVTVAPNALVPGPFASHSYNDFNLLMPLYLCRTWSGVPRGQENQQLAWVALSDLDRYPMPPADLPLIPILRKIV